MLKSLQVTFKSGSRIVKDFVFAFLTIIMTDDHKVIAAFRR